MKKVNPTNTSTWKKLNEHYNNARFFDMKSLFAKDASRAEKYTIKWEDFYVDYSKNLISEETKNLLVQLAEEIGLKEAIENYFNGEKINETEDRPVLHIALRTSHDDKIFVDGTNVVPEIYQAKEKISKFTNSIVSGERKGFTGKSFTDVVNIGIGGSDLGPVMVTEALKFYKNHLKIHFISNVDGDHVSEVIQDLNLGTTLFIIVSKSFTTQETLTNATKVKNLFSTKLPSAAIPQHFVAVSSNIAKVEEFGILKENIFPMWNWVGGRFSLWSAVGLSISLSIGFSNFERLLEGAKSMDQHFRSTNFHENIPVQLALLSVWYNNFFKTETEAIIPYSQYLHRFPAYLQQAVMESNGKCVDRNGDKISYQTGNIIWGEPGTNAQHAFFQLIHQGTKLIPTDFIGFLQPLHADKEQHDILMANYFAQTEALLVGKSENEVKNENFRNESAKNLSPFKTFNGNKPTTSILINKLSPSSLGKLIALYEHKIFAQGIIWNIYSFDQWGVELGKQLAGNILNELKEESGNLLNSSTASQIKHYKKY